MKSNACVLGVSDIRTKGTIVVFDGPNVPKGIDLNIFCKKEITFGRDKENDIILTSQLVSRHHGAFVFENDQWYIVDRESTNGVIHNGREEAKIILQDDDYVRIDDGVETISDGVLILFPSSQYSEEWITISSSEMIAYLSQLLFFADALVDLRDGRVNIRLKKTDSILINRHRPQSDIVLHEKDVISFPGHRIIYTSTGIYDNVQVFMHEGEGFCTERADIDGDEERYNREPIDVQGSQSNRTVRLSESVVNVEEICSEPSNETQFSESARSEYDQPSELYEEHYQQLNNTIMMTQRSSGGFRNFLASSAGYYVMSMVLAIVIWGITVALWASEGEAALVVIGVCTFFGWKTLNSIQPVMFLWMSWTGWIVYFVIKFILSAIIGLFVAPFKIGKWIAGAISDSV